MNRNYNLDEAAELLQCHRRYLEDNLKRLPHQKIGAAVAFDEEELAAIKDMHRVRPTAPSASAAGNTAPSLAQIRPKRRRTA